MVAHSLGSWHLSVTCWCSQALSLALCLPPPTPNSWVTSVTYLDVTVWHILMAATRFSDRPLLWSSDSYLSVSHLFLDGPAGTSSSSPKLKIPYSKLLSVGNTSIDSAIKFGHLGITLDSFPIPIPNGLTLPSKIVPEFFPLLSIHLTSVFRPSSIRCVRLLVPVVSPYNQLFPQPPLSASSLGNHNELQTCFRLRFTLVDCQCENLTTYQDVKKNKKACICHSLFCLDCDNEDCRCCDSNRAEHILANIQTCPLC